jgi:DNA-binding MarR family transcriptional regulator
VLVPVEPVSSHPSGALLGHQLGPADLRCLDWLVDGPRTARQLSSAAGLRPPATTALIDRLERRGWAAYGPMRGHLEAIRELTDRHRERLAATEEEVATTT